MTWWEKWLADYNFSQQSVSIPQGHYFTEVSLKITGQIQRTLYSTPFTYCKSLHQTTLASVISPPPSIQAFQWTSWWQASHSPHSSSTGSVLSGSYLGLLPSSSWPAQAHLTILLSHSIRLSVPQTFWVRNLKRFTPYWWVVSKNLNRGFFASSGYLSRGSSASSHRLCWVDLLAQLWSTYPQALQDWFSQSLYCGRCTIMDFRNCGRDVLL